MKRIGIIYAGRDFSIGEEDFVGYMKHLGLPHPKQMEVAVPANLLAGPAVAPAGPQPRARVAVAAKRRQRSSSEAHVAGTGCADHDAARSVPRADGR
jgi:hypothetical protein